jgi:hypothetical protein
MRRLARASRNFFLGQAGVWSAGFSPLRRTNWQGFGANDSHNPVRPLKRRERRAPRSRFPKRNFRRLAIQCGKKSNTLNNDPKSPNIWKGCNFFRILCAT